MPLNEPDRLASLHATGLGASADQAFDRITALVRRLLDVPVALVSLVSADEQFFPGQSGLERPWADDRRTPLSHSFCQHVVTSGRSLVIADAREDDLVRDNLAISDLAVIAYLGHPLTDVDGRVLGSLCAMGHEPRVWTEDDQALLGELAAITSSELRLRHTKSSLQDLLGRTRLLQQVGEAVGSTLDPYEALTRLTRLVVPALAQWCTVGLVDLHGSPTMQLGRHAVAERSQSVQQVADAQTLASAGAPHQRALRAGEAVHSRGPDLTGLVGVPSVVPPTGCALTVPLGERGHLTLGRGLLEPFSPLDSEQLLDLGRRVGLALDNAELYREQRSSAEALQKSLLTLPTEPDHLDIVAKYEPASRVAQVGGDWYDAFQQVDGSTVLVVGDVMGHDMTAAGMMGQVRNILRGVLHDRPESPSLLVSRVDRALRQLEVDTLATMVVARLEPAPHSDPDAGRRMVWTNAGHPPPVLVHPDGAVQLLESDGELLVGLDPAAHRTDHAVMLEPGGTVLFYTDGLIERRQAPIDAGIVRMRQAVSAVAHLPLEPLLSQLLERLREDEPEDDVAVVGVRLLAAGYARGAAPPPRVR